MFPGVLALLERSLRVDARAWGPHLARFGLAFAIYVAVIMASEMSMMFGAPGLRFFRNIVYLDLFFITLLGVTYFSTSITEEREEDTLGLMLMAGINPLGILLGKSGGRLIQAFLLMAVQYPFTLLAITLGGITQSQIRHTYVSILAYLIMLAGLGLLCSTLSRRNRNASSRLTMIVLLYWVLPMASSAVLRRFSPLGVMASNILNWISQSCIVFEIGTAMTSSANETWWTPQVITNSAVGGLGFLCSWLCFDLAARDPATEVQTRGMVTRSRTIGKLFAPGSPWKNAIAWKDFHFVAGGKAAFLIRIALYVSLYFLVVNLSRSLIGISSGPEETRFITGFYLTLVMLLAPIDAAWIVSRSLGEELRSQTLAPLILLPISSGRILYSKIAGSLLGWLPAPACLGLGIYFLPHGLQHVYDFFEHPGPPAFFITHLILLPHLAALLAMFIRWGAFPIAIGLTVGSMFLIVCTIEMMRPPQFDPLFLLASCGVVVICIACHIGVRLRTDALVAR